MINIKSQLRSGYTIFFRCGGRAECSMVLNDERAGIDCNGKEYFGHLVVFGEAGKGGPAHNYRNDGSYMNYPKGESQHPFDIVEIKSNILRICK